MWSVVRRGGESVKLYKAVAKGVRIDVDFSALAKIPPSRELRELAAKLVGEVRRFKSLGLGSP